MLMHASKRTISRTVVEASAALFAATAGRSTMAQWRRAAACPATVFKHFGSSTHWSRRSPRRDRY